MADSRYTIFQPRSVQEQPEQSVDNRSFLEKYPSPFSFVGQKLGLVNPNNPDPVPTPTAQSSYTIFKPREQVAPVTPDPEQYPYDKYVKPVASFGMQTLTSGLGQLAQGATGLFSLSRNFPRRVVDLATKPIFSPNDQGQTFIDKTPWLKEALNNYETAFDAIKNKKLPELTTTDGSNKATFKNVNIGTELLPSLAATGLAVIPSITSLLQKGQDELYKQYQPEFAKNPNFLATYETMSLREKILKHPSETLRLIAPNVIGSGAAIAGTTFLTGGAGLGSLVLSAATGEDVKNAAIKSGIDPLKAETIGIATAVPVMFLEKFGFDTILGKGVLKNIGTSFGGRILKSMATESSTEVTQEGIQLAMENTFREVTGDEVKSRLAMAGLGGALGGLAFGTTASAFNTLASRAEVQEGKRATQRLGAVIDESPKAEIIERGLDYKPTETSVLKQSFVDSMVKDVGQQVDLIADETTRSKTLNSIQRLSKHEYKNMREFELYLSKVIPNDLDIRASNTIIGQEFSNAIAASDPSSQAYIAEFAFEDKINGKRSPIDKTKIKLLEPLPPVSGGEAAPPQNVLGDLINRLKETADDIRREKKGKTLDPQTAKTLLDTQRTIAKLQKVYNAETNKQELKAKATSNVFAPNTAIIPAVEGVQAPAQLNIQTTPTVRRLTPVQSTGTQQVSRLASKVEANAVEQKLSESLGSLPTYARANMKEQSELATQLLERDPVLAKRIALGDEAAPDNLLPESIFTAVEQLAIQNEDVNTLRELATSSTLSLEATAMGQRIRALGEREQYAPTSVISTVLNIREDQATKQGVSVAKQKSEITQQIKEEIKKTQTQPKDWQSFIDELQC